MGSTLLHRDLTLAGFKYLYQIVDIDRCEAFTFHFCTHPHLRDRAIEYAPDEDLLVFRFKVEPYDMAGRIVLIHMQALVR